MSCGTVFMVIVGGLALLLFCFVLIPAAAPLGIGILVVMLGYGVLALIQRAGNAIDGEPMGETYDQTYRRTRFRGGIGALLLIGIFLFPPALLAIPVLLLLHYLVKK